MIDQWDKDLEQLIYRLDDAEKAGEVSTQEAIGALQSAAARLQMIARGIATRAKIEESGDE